MTQQQNFLNSLVEMLKALNDDERTEVLNNFCRSCGTYIQSSDWADLNYCYSCSPDPRE